MGLIHHGRHERHECNCNHGVHHDKKDDTFENWDGGLYSWILHNKFKEERGNWD